jgi:ABC-type transport system involved in multi-copper enzyme maturation permease subunit
MLDVAVECQPSHRTQSASNCNRDAIHLRFAEYMYRTFVIIRHTFRETVSQPIYTLLLAIGVAIIVVFGLLPFFTLGEDTVMFKSVALDVILLLVLIQTLFATSKSIYEEIEDRTMLTLMSKPVHKWEVLVGKYLGIILAALLGVAILGGILALATWLRIPTDYQLRASTLDERELRNILEHQHMHIAGELASLLLVWFQISVLAAIGVAISTRLSLVVNLPLVIILYIAGNLTRFLYPLKAGAAANALSYAISLILPFLEIFDLRQVTVYRPIALAGTQFASDPNAVSLATIWGYVGVAALYAVAYITFALSAGMWLFQSRELGGAEG